MATDSVECRVQFTNEAGDEDYVTVLARWRETDERVILTIGQPDGSDFPIRLSIVSLAVLNQDLMEIARLVQRS